MKDSGVSNASISLQSATQCHPAHYSGHLIKYTALGILLYRARYNCNSRGKRVRKALFSKNFNIYVLNAIQKPFMPGHLNKKTITFKAMNGADI